MENGLLILKRIVEANREVKPILNFAENKKCYILISNIDDKHKGIKPSMIECLSVPDLYAKLRFVLSRGEMPPYDMVLGWVKEHGYVKLIKEDRNGKIRYRA